jgi:hypothetical protein
VTPGTRARLEAALRGLRLTWVGASDEVRAELTRGRFDLVVIGAHFDESTWCDALRFVTSSSPESRIVCLRGVVQGSLLGQPSIDAFRAACDALGAALVLDLVHYPDNEAGNRALRALFERELELAA